MFQGKCITSRQFWLILALQFASLFSTTALASKPPVQRISYQEAERLLQLNMMLLVTHRRCSILKQPFDREFISFHNVLKDKLEIASAIVRPKFEENHNNLTLDNFLTATANSYGEGHPQHNCKQIKAEIATLLKLKSDHDFYKVADQLLIGAPKHAHTNVTYAVDQSVTSNSVKEVANESSAARSEPALASKMDAGNSAQNKAPEKAKEKVSTPVNPSTTKDYTGGSLIKDF